MPNSLLLILVVEDDFLVQDLIRDALTEGGFETDIMASGEEAIALLQADKTKYRALLTDINLQGKLTGWEVGKRARELNPEMPVRLHDRRRIGSVALARCPNSVLLNKPFGKA